MKILTLTIGIDDTYTICIDFVCCAAIFSKVCLFMYV